MTRNLANHTNRNIGRTMLVLALATVLSSAIAQSSAPSIQANPAPQEQEPSAATPLIPAQTLVPAVQNSAPIAASNQVAQGAPPAPPAPPAVQNGSSVDPVDALQQTVQQNQGQATGATPPAKMGTDSDQMVSPYVVPPSGPGIFQGADHTFREISYLKAEEDLIKARTARESALQAQAKAHTELKDILAGRDPDRQGQSAAGGGQPAADPQAIEAQRQAQAAALARKIAQTPYVNSVYMYGDKAYAEIVIGSTWTMASPGTVLTSGDRVVDISPSGVVVSGRKGRRTLPVRGSAAIE